VIQYFAPTISQSIQIEIAPASVMVFHRHQDRLNLNIASHQLRSERIFAIEDSLDQR
jgi:hypothetical protein